jgi:CBS domain-containing protein
MKVLDDNKLVGIISIGDIVEALLHHRNKKPTKSFRE